MTAFSHRTFQGLSATQAYVLGEDGNLWLESAPWGNVPPSREQVDDNVAALQALSATQAYVLGKDGNMWLESGPWGHVPPSREQVNVTALQALTWDIRPGAIQAYVLGKTATCGRRRAGCSDRTCYRPATVSMTTWPPSRH